MDTLTYFASQSALTDLGGYAEQVAALPNDVAGICKAIQGLFLDYRERYKYPIVNERLLCTNARYVKAVIGWVMKLGKNAPLTEARIDENWFTATCSDYANLFVAVARAKGMPARKRVGFVGNETWEAAEYWDGKAWITIDPSGLAQGEFVPAWKVWQDCRAGKLDPAQFKGDCNSRLTGWAVIRNSLMLDLAAMNKIELLTWDRYGWMNRCVCEMSDRAWEILDQAAAVLADADKDLDAVHALYDAQEGLQVPRVIWCDSPVAPPHKVELTF